MHEFKVFQVIGKNFLELSQTSQHRYAARAAAAACSVPAGG